MNIFLVNEQWDEGWGYNLLTSGFEDEQDAIAYLKKRYQDILKRCGAERKFKENVCTDTYAKLKTMGLYPRYYGNVVELTVKKSSKR